MIKITNIHRPSFLRPLCDFSLPHLQAATDPPHISLHVLEFCINRASEWVCWFWFCFFFHSASHFKIYPCCSHLACCWEAFHHMDTTEFIYSPVDGHLGCVQYMTSTNKAAINIHVQVFMWVCVFISLCCMLFHHHNA